MCTRHAPHRALENDGANDEHAAVHGLLVALCLILPFWALLVAAAMLI